MKSHIPVFLASDDGYAPFVATTIASICYNTRSFIDFYVIDGGISTFHQRQIALLKKIFQNFSLEFVKIDANKMFNELPIMDHVSPTTYSRLLAPEIINKPERAIYSDVDVICLGDIREMYEQDLAAHVIGAVYHAYFDNNDGRTNRSLCLNLDINPEHKYFYGGNLLIDCVKWRENMVTSSLLDIADKYRQRLFLGDQCILNKYFEDNNYKLLDYKFCLTTQDCEYFSRTNNEEYVRLTRDVVIRHFETPMKPWLTDMRKEREVEHFVDFWFFASMTPFYTGMRQKFIARLMREIVAPNKSPSTKELNSKKAIFANLRSRIRSWQ